MILHWTKNGLFGLASHGPGEGTRITAPVQKTMTTTWTQTIDVSKDAEEKIEEWPSYGI